MTSTIMDTTIIHHVIIVLFVLRCLNSFNCCHPLAYLVCLFYLYMVHERYVMRLQRKLHCEEKRNADQRRVLSDSETVRWLNHAIKKIWPICMEEIVSQKLLLPIVPWFLEKYKPWTAKEAVIQHLYLGRSPPLFTDMRILRQPSEEDHLVIELGMKFQSAKDMSALLAVKMRKRLGLGIWANMHLLGFHVEGKVMVGMKFIRHWPFLGRLRVCFAQPPYFQMTIKPLFGHGLDVTELPGIDGWVDKLLSVAFEETLVEPNMLVVDMEKFASRQRECWFSFDVKEPIAHAIVEVLEADEIKPSNANGLVDPYVKGELGPYRFRSKTQKKTLSPKWNEEFKIPICTWESPVLKIEVCDDDHTNDDKLGSCSININDVRDGQRHDIWLSLKNNKVGILHLALSVVEAKSNGKECEETYDAFSDYDSRSDSCASDMIEGQEETEGIRVVHHHQGSVEVGQIWDPRKGMSMLGRHSHGESVGSTRSLKSTESGSCRHDGSSTDESTDDDKDNSKHKIRRGLKKIGSMFHRRRSRVGK